MDLKTVKALETEALEVVFEALNVHDSLIDHVLLSKSKLVLEEMQQIKGYSSLTKGT
jgi:hypothetical protein